jgi:hypothetical protein
MDFAAAAAPDGLPIPCDEDNNASTFAALLADVTAGITPPPITERKP